MAEVISEGILPGVQVNLFGYYLINLFPGESTAERMKYCLRQRPEYIRQLFHIAELNLVDGCKDALLVRDKDGKMMSILLRIFLLHERDGVKLFYLNVMNVEPEQDYEDIRQELRETKEQISFLENALDRLPNPVFIKDSEARFLFFNEQYAKTFGMRQEDYIGKTVMKLEEMAYVDSGTGLFNRTILSRKEAEFKSKGMAAKTCALMCDLDHFKRVNDTYGHTEGDAILAKDYGRNCVITESTKRGWIRWAKS